MATAVYLRQPQAMPKVQPSAFDVGISWGNCCLGGFESKSPANLPLRRRPSLPRACRSKKSRQADPPPLYPPVTTPSTRAAAAPEAQEDGFCEADFAGATTSVHHAQCLLGTRVGMIFAKAPFAGTVQGYEVFSDFSDRIQHQVVFDDGSAQDYALSGVLAGTEAYIRVRAASGGNAPAIAVQPVAPNPNAPTAAEVTTESPEPVALGAPASFASYPLRLFLRDA